MHPSDGAAADCEAVVDLSHVVNRSHSNELLSVEDTS